jgi:hypothetical protein
MKKCMIVLCVALFFVLSLFATVYADSARDTVTALKKLQARCQSGVSYREYVNALGDAKFPVNLFIGSAEAQKFPDLTASINKAMKHYEYASTLWNTKMSSKFGDLIKVDSPKGGEIKILYPVAQPSKVNKDEHYYVDSLLPVIWNAATKELDETTKLYAAIEEKSLSEIDTLKKENRDLRAEVDQLKNEEVDKLRKEMDPLRKHKKVTMIGR